MAPLLLYSCAILVRVLIGLGGYSGQGKPPMHGDFEAQRHWMEVTTALPVGDWYRLTEENDLHYWGLDYPPLTAYVSWAYGKMAHSLVPELVVLHTSRGHESESGKLFMRFSVLILDLLLFLPALAYAARQVVRQQVAPALSKTAASATVAARAIAATNGNGSGASSPISPSSPVKLSPNKREATAAAQGGGGGGGGGAGGAHSSSSSSPVKKKHGSSGGIAAAAATVFLTLSCFLCPSIILIDNGHFQYNGVCIGLALLACVAMTNRRDILCSILFCLSLNFKQMSLYYAPVFFFALLRNCGERTSWLGKIMHLIVLGITVIATFAALWWPLCRYATTADGETCISSLLHGLSRQFPFARGIFEDKVANLWYVFSVIIDFRLFVSQKVLIRASLVLTLLLLAPTAYSLLRYPLTPRRLLLALVNSALAFFLAAFQVHEKSLLLALVPASLLLPLEPLLVCWFQLLGIFSMFPLLQKDRLVLPYYVLAALYVASVIVYTQISEATSLHLVSAVGGGSSSEDKKKKTNKNKRNNNNNESGSGTTSYSWLKYTFVALSFLGMLTLHLLEAFVPPPSRYPHFYPALFSIYSAGNLLVAYVFGVSVQALLLPCYLD